MLRHVVLMSLSEDAPADQRETIIRELDKLPAVIPEVLSLSVGSDAGLAAGNHDLAVVAEFADAAGYEVYAKNAQHIEVIATHIKPWLTNRSAVQYPC